MSSARRFQDARKLIDGALQDSGLAAKINAAVAELVPET